jgi:6,7-dimethyl-8-ribityllumazine synthase
MIKKSPQTEAPLTFASPPHVLILEARFYEDINDLLIEGAVAALAGCKATHEILTVPGALELPVALQLCAQRSDRTFDAFIALGCVIRGETTHYETVCNESARGLTDVALKLSLAVGNGILTVENKEQALERADKSRLDKGGGAARAALRMLQIKQS